MGQIVPATNGNMLAKLETACRALAEARGIKDVKTLRDQAQTIQDLLKRQGYCLEAQQQAGELKVRAERRLGELLPTTIQKGGNPKSHDVTLNELGIGKMDSSRWQQLATVPEQKFEQHIAQAKEKRQEVTTAGVLKLAKTISQPGKQERPSAEDGCTVEDLFWAAEQGRRYGCIYADPPWPYDNQATRASTDNHYKTMTLDDICELPIKQLVADDAHLHLWTTNAFIFDCPRIIEAWGFDYKSMFVWCKPQMGIGNYWRVSHEILLFGTRGKCPFKSRSLMSWGQYKRGRHSSKPAEIRGFIELASPGPYLELFARREVRGWQVWGDDVKGEEFRQEAFA